MDPSSSTSTPEDTCILLLGQQGGGKRALVNRFVLEKFTAPDDTSHDAHYRKTVDLDGQKEIIAGIYLSCFEWPSFVRQSISSCRAVILVYSITSRSSLEEMKHIYKSFRDVMEERSLPVFVLGTKRDRAGERQVEVAEAKAFSTRRGWPYFEASAVTGEGVDEVFYGVLREIRRRRLVRVESTASSGDATKISLRAENEECKPGVFRFIKRTLRWRS